MTPDFEECLNNILNNIHGNCVDVNSGDLHRQVGGYPGRNHRMPVCCEVMYGKMKGDDAVLSAPPKGKGASLTIRYFKHNR
jgi:5-methylcytosine-specific restriction protein A